MTTTTTDRVLALETLIEVNSQIHAEEFHPERVLALIVDRARELIGADVAFMGLADEKRHLSICPVASGAVTGALVAVEVELGAGLSGLASRNGGTVVLAGDELHASIPSAGQAAIRAEGIVTVMCAPMHHGKDVGALVVGSRHETRFDDAQRTLLQALASQAAIAIANSRLYQTLAEKNATLEQTLALHRALGDAALDGDGLDAIVQRLAKLVRRDVALIDPDRSRPGRRYFADGREPAPLDSAPNDPANGRHVRVVIGDEDFGSLYLLGSEEAGEVARNALLQAATIVALEMTKERAAHEAEWRLRGELLEEMLRAGDSWSEGLLLRCERLGADPAAERCLAILEPLDPAKTTTLAGVVRTAASRLVEGKTTLISRRGERVLVALETDARTAADAVESLLVRAERASAPARAGISSARRRVSVAVREAEAAVRLARESRRPNTAISYRELGRLRFLLSAPDTTEMGAMVRDLLGPLAAHDRKRNGSLLETLRTYLETGGHHPTTAKHCHIHASTLKYRLTRIAEVLDRPLSDPKTRFELSLAFAVRDVLATMGVEVP